MGLVGAVTGSPLSMDDEVVVGIECVSANDDEIICPPPNPATPPPLAPISSPLSSPTVVPHAATALPIPANTVLDTAEAVIAATGDVCCDSLGGAAADD